MQEIDPEELRMALVERGVDVMGRSDAELRAVLAGWLKNTRGKEEERSAVSYHRLFLTRSVLSFPFFFFYNFDLFLEPSRN